MTPVPPALEVVDLHRRFGAVTALDGVSLAVPGGEVHALIGPNGAGKTTLLRILAGLTDPSAGDVRILGRDVGELGYRERRKAFSLVPSGERSSYLRLSGRENLVFFGRLYGLAKAAARRRAAECLALVSLTEAADRAVGVYSQGMQKRLAIARALLVDPPVLLIDEATQSLDPEGARTTRRLAREAADRGAAVMWTTQRLDEIRGFADRVTMLRRGQVVFHGTVPAFIALVNTRVYLLQTPGPVDPIEVMLPDSILERIAGDHYRLRLGEGVSLGQVLATLVEAGVEIEACRQEVSEVEEAYVRLTGEP